MSHRNTEHREDRIISTLHNKRLASPSLDECHKLRKDYNKLRNIYNRTSNDSDKVKKKKRTTYISVSAREKVKPMKKSRLSK